VLFAKIGMSSNQQGKKHQTTNKSKPINTNPSEVFVIPHRNNKMAVLVPYSLRNLPGALFSGHPHHCPNPIEPSNVHYRGASMNVNVIETTTAISLTKMMACISSPSIQRSWLNLPQAS
jgi:hypothetical protein